MEGVVGEMQAYTEFLQVLSDVTIHSLFGLWPFVRYLAEVERGIVQEIVVAGISDG